MSIFEELFGLDGRVAVVTGGGRGIGKESARVLAKAGATVVVADKDGTAGDGTVTELREIGLSARAITTDISDEAQIIDLMQRTRDLFGRLDILVNNAASVLKFDVLTMTSSQWDEMQQTNLRGTFLCTREALKHMKGNADGGRIINISSIASVHPSVYGNMCYGASKAGINAITQYAALEFAVFGISVNAILPGPTETDALARVLETSFIPKGPAVSPERRLMGRKGKPIELAAAVLFLASPAASYITGQCIAVDGGFLIS